MAFVEANLGKIGASSIVTVTEEERGTFSGRWKWAIGKYREWSLAKDISCKKGQYSMTFTTHLRDFYDWPIDGVLGAVALPDWLVKSGIFGTGKGQLLYDKDMAMLHRLGVCKQFWIRGSYTDTIEWRKGERYGLTKPLLPPSETRSP